MNRIVIFGATGNTGLCALNSAVNKGVYLVFTIYIKDLFNSFGTMRRYNGSLLAN